jgi:hypothetical protein
MSGELNLLPGEEVRREGPARWLVSNVTAMGYNPINGTLWTTSQRVIFRGYQPRSRYIAGGSYVAEYPISHVTNAEMVRMRVQWSDSSVLKLTFDNTGREYFAVNDSAAWNMDILNARQAASALPYSTIPPTKSGVEATGGQRTRMMLYIFGGILGCFLLACAGLYISSYFMK